MANDYASRIKKVAAQQRKGGSSSYASKIQKIAAEQGGSSGTNWKAAAAGTSASEPKEKGPVAWILDMLDRPGNATRTSISESFKAEKKALENGKSGFELAAPIIGGAIRGIGEGFTGKKHNTTSQIVEDYSDDVGSFDPNYKNVKDNVNPWVKGIGGFVGDVALDPLTYIPGADLFSVAGKTVKGVKAGTEAVKALETGASTTEKIATAAKAGARAATKRAVPKVAAVPRAETKVSEDMVARIAENQAPKAADAVPSPVPVAPRPEPVNPSELKPAIAEAPEPTVLSKQDWMDNQLADQPDTLKVGTTETTPGDVRRVLSDDTADLTTEEVRNARAWARKNLNDDAYTAYQKSFKNRVSKAPDAVQQVVATARAADPDKASQRVLAALADATKNIARGARKTDNLDFNEIDQSRLFGGTKRDGIAGLIQRHVDEKGHANGLEQNVARFQNVVKDSKAVLDQMEQRGVPASVGGTPMRADEVLQHIGEANPRSAAFLVNGTGRTNMDTVLQAARDAAHSSLSDDELYSALYPRIYQATAKAGGQFEKIGQGQKALPGYKVSAQEIAGDLTKALVSKRGALADDVAAKASYWAERRGEQTVNISNAVLKSLRDVQENGTPGQYLQALASIERDTKAYGKAVGAVAGASDDAAQAVLRQVPDVDIKVAKGSAQAVDKAVEASTKPVRPAMAIDAAQMAAKPGAKRQFEAVIDEVDEDIAEFARKSNTPVEDFGPKAAQQYIAGLGSMLYGGLSKFKADFVAGKYFGLYTGSQSLTHNYLSAVSKGLTGFSKHYSPEVRQGALKALQTGVTPSDPALAQAAEELRPLVDRLFNLDNPDALINDSFLRQGANMNEVNRFIRHEAYRIDMDAAMERASRNGTDFLQEVSQQWKYMDVADPVDYVMQMHQAMIDQAGVHNIAQTFTKHAVDNNLASKTPKAGFIKIRPEKDSYLGKYLDEGTYYDKGSIQALRDVDRLIGEMRNVNRVPKMIKTFDTVQNMWKVGMTSLRPGFHIRNSIGDTALTLLDVPFINPKNITGAVKVLTAHNSYDGFDAVKVLRNAGESELTGKGDKALTLRFNGGRQSLTNEDVYRLAKDEGLLADFGHLEGLIDDSASPLRKGLDAVGKKTGFNHLVKGANAVATFETHHARLVHFMQLMERDARKFNNVTALAEYAARRVKRFHPDPSMLSPFEKKVMRRIIPFYSWQRAMIPLIAESLLTRPGRVMMYPKASYNMGVSMGVDPYSISQPFPEDQQFPSFISEQATGPVANVDGKNYSISPGIAQVDILNDYVGANPIRSVAGSLTPALKAPIELLSGTNLQTGGPIKSPSEYIMGQIPGVNYVSRAANNASAEGADADPEANKLLLSNWLSGLGIQDLNKPSYQRYAQYEQSQKNGNG
jgi:CRISPR/Cas system-associated protein endoribonuclease Cas2